MNSLALHHPSKSSTNTPHYYFSAWNSVQQARFFSSSSFLRKDSFSCDSITIWLCGRSHAHVYFAGRDENFTVREQNCLSSPLYFCACILFSALVRRVVHFTIVVQIVVWVSWLTGLRGNSLEWNVWVAVGSHTSFELVPVITVIMTCTQLSLHAWPSASVT